MLNQSRVCLLSKAVAPGLAQHLNSQYKELSACTYCRWVPDELGVSSFAQLDDLKTIPVTSFDARFDVWHVEAPLSEGCGGPELPEEVML